MLMRTNMTEGDERLLRVAQACRESPHPQAFNMGMFVHACGTPACALGHYGARQDLQNVYRVIRSCRFGNDQRDMVAYDLEAARRGAYRPDVDEVAYEHFELDYRQYTELFACDGCGGAQTPEQAADYIERFVARRIAAREALV
jgi:hypothetical protein